MSEWKPIETAPKDGTEVIVGFDIATVWITRGASWCDGFLWQDQGFSSVEDAEGWWSYENSVSAIKLDDFRQPTHWLPRPDPPK